MSFSTRKFTKTTTAIGLVFILSGCATIDPPHQQMAEARTHLDSARQENADQYAELAMKRARDRIQQAEQAMEGENFKHAKRLAEEAIADLKVARVTANTEKMKQALKEVDASLKTLKSELELES